MSDRGIMGIDINSRPRDVNHRELWTRVWHPTLGDMYYVEDRVLLYSEWGVKQLGWRLDSAQVGLQMWEGFLFNRVKQLGVMNYFGTVPELDDCYVVYTRVEYSYIDVVTLCSFNGESLDWDWGFVIPLRELRGE